VGLQSNCSWPVLVTCNRTRRKIYALETDFLFDCFIRQTYDLRDEILGICAIMSESFYRRLTGDGFPANAGDFILPTCD
jgi:hypothetical protein